LGDGFHGPVLMYYLLMLLVCSYRAAKTQNPAGQPSLNASDSFWGLVFKALFSNLKMALVLDRLHHEFS
jgi:hypothetical protein